MWVDFQIPFTPSVGFPGNESVAATEHAPHFHAVLHFNESFPSPMLLTCSCVCVCECDDSVGYVKCFGDSNPIGISSPTTEIRTDALR